MMLTAQDRSDKDSHSPAEVYIFAVQQQTFVQNEGPRLKLSSLL